MVYTANSISKDKNKMIVIILSDKDNKYHIRLNVFENGYYLPIKTIDEDIILKDNLFNPKNIIDNYIVDIMKNIQYNITYNF